MRKNGEVTTTKEQTASLLCCYRLLDALTYNSGKNNTQLLPAHDILLALSKRPSLPAVYGEYPKPQYLTL